jgi:WXG100 family type VII secretion target
MGEDQSQNMPLTTPDAPNDSNEPDMIRVDTRAIRDTSAHIRAVLKSIEETQTTLQNALGSFEACWEGSASEAYTQASKKVLNRLAQQHAVYATYPDRLVNHAETREQADGSAKEVAMSIETPQWAYV